MAGNTEFIGKIGINPRNGFHLIFFHIYCVVSDSVEEVTDDEESDDSVGFEDSAGFEEAADSSGSLDEVALLLSEGVVGSSEVLSLGADGVCPDEVLEDTADEVSAITSEDTTLLASLEELL